MDLNYLQAKLFKAEMTGDLSKIDECTKQIEEFKKNNPDAPQPWEIRAREERSYQDERQYRDERPNGDERQFRDERPNREERPYRGDPLLPEDRKALNQLKDELNLLSSKKLKAEMLGKTELCDEYQAKIEEHQRKLEDFKAKLQIDKPPEQPPQSPVELPVKPPPVKPPVKPPSQPIKQPEKPIPEKPTRKVDAAKLLEQCKKEIEELHSRQQGNPRKVTLDPNKVEEMKQLNLLNARLLKAQMLRDEAKIKELKEQIAEVTESAKMSKEDDEMDGLTLKQQEEQMRNVERLNELSAKLLKAELRNDERMMEECKNEIEEFTRLAEKEPVSGGRPAEEDFNFIEVFESLVQANKVNDKQKIDACKTKIDAFEETFNFKHRGDLEKLVSLSGAALAKTMKLKMDAEMNGDLLQANDLDKRAKAIRKKNIDYTARLEELIAAEPRKERVVKSRVHPLFGKPEPKKEPETQTIRVIKKFKEENMSLSQMFVSERRAGADSEDARFVNSSSKLRSADDEYEETASSKRRKNDAGEYQRERVEDEEEKCYRCLDRIKDRLLIAYDEKAYIAIPEKEPMIEHQLVIRGAEHCPSLVFAGEDVVETVNQYKQKLCAVFASIDKKLIFIENYLKHSTKWNKHFELSCYPIDAELLENSKMFFMKDINDSGSEWATNKKLVSLDGEPIRKKVPKEMSYFCVTFGPSNDGFAHVIEDRQRFSKNFGEAIIGGMLDIEPQKWLKPALQHYGQQEERSSELKKLWNKFNQVSTK